MRKLKSKGFSLVEVMVSTAIMLIVSLSIVNMQMNDSWRSIKNYGVFLVDTSMKSFLLDMSLNLENRNNNDKIQVMNIYNSVNWNLNTQDCLLDHEYETDCFSTNNIDNITVCDLRKNIYLSAKILKCNINSINQNALVELIDCENDINYSCLYINLDGIKRNINECGESNECLQGIIKK